MVVPVRLRLGLRMMKLWKRFGELFRFPRKSDEDLFRESTMTFGEHLEELRQCLFRALVGLMVGFLIGLLVADQVVDWIQVPLRRALVNYYTREANAIMERRLKELTELGYSEKMLGEAKAQQMFPERVFVNPHELAKQLGLTLPEEGEIGDGNGPSGLVEITMWKPIVEDRRVRTASLNAHEAFAIYVKAALLVGVVLASPWIFIQIWRFVAAGLYWHERKFVYIFLPFSLGLFLLGVAIAFFVVFDPVLQFLLAFNSWLKIDPEPRISEWLNFVLILPLGFGITFQLPLVMLFLERIGVFTVQNYLSQWKIAVVVIFTLAMLFTPPDPWSMIAMAIPLSGLYFGGILLCTLLPRRTAPILPPPT